jgi:prepilin-type N-terminal cleavage/methylation domain-containing protein
VKRPEAGFTLIEVLVALAVGAIVLTAGMAALATVHDRSEHARMANAEALEAAAVRSTLIDWLSSTQNVSQELGARFEGRSADESELVWDELTFPTRARTSLRVPMTVIRLFIDEDPATREQGLVAELVGRLGDEPVRLELVPQAVGLRLRYLPYADPPVEWSPGWVGQPQLPRAVELTLFDLPEHPLPPLLRLPLRVVPESIGVDIRVNVTTTPQGGRGGGR